MNIANEAGGQGIADNDFKTIYKEAIANLRKAGVESPIVIDATAWGQDIPQLFRAGPEVAESDTLKNVVFSVHLYGASGWNADAVNRLGDQIVAWSYPIIIGEFANATPGFCSTPTDYRRILAVSQQKEIGWLAWSWGGVGNAQCGNQFNMSNGSFSGLTGWGLEVSVTDGNSIQNTSRRPRSIVTGRCQ